MVAACSAASSAPRWLARCRDEIVKVTAWAWDILADLALQKSDQMFARSPRNEGIPRCLRRGCEKQKYQRQPRWQGEACASIDLELGGIIWIPPDVQRVSAWRMPNRRRTDGHPSRASSVNHYGKVVFNPI